MTAIPQPDTFLERLALWHDLQAQLKSLKQQEILLRKSLFAEAFPNPAEGNANYVLLAGGYRLQGKYPIERKIDMTHLAAMRDELARMKVSIDPLLNWSVALQMKAYRALSDEARTLFDNILTVSPGTPSMDIIAPKDNELPQPAPTVDEWVAVSHGAGKTASIGAPEEVETPAVTIEMPAKKPARKSRAKKADA